MYVMRVCGGEEPAVSVLRGPRAQAGSASTSRIPQEKGSLPQLERTEVVTDSCLKKRLSDICSLGGSSFPCPWEMLSERMLANNSGELHVLEARTSPFAGHKRFSTEP